MNIDQYRKLLQSFCVTVGLDPVALLEHGTVTVDGMDMQLIFNEEADPEWIHIRIDLGLRFEELGHQAHRELLAANYKPPSHDSINVSVHPQLGNVILGLKSPASLDMTPEKLANHLQHHAQNASDWRNAFQST